MQTILDAIFSIPDGDADAFEAVWQQVYAFQRANNVVYNRYCIELEGEIVPYLPIEAFKHAPVISFDNADAAEMVFQSSGTGRGGLAKHYVKDLSVYQQASAQHFASQFGNGPLTLAAYLPHYTQMGTHSSLLYMVQHLVEQFGDAQSGFFLEKEHELVSLAAHAEPDTPFILFGAAFGLLDLVEKHAIKLPAHAIVIETGGMKTYRKEISRKALHNQLAEGFGIHTSQVRSEYGMCELLSQCYTQGGHAFQTPPWMRAAIMDPENPLSPQVPGKPGALAVIDLANIYSVSAILTQDKAVQTASGFEVLGRLQGAELRGCNFLLEHM